MKGGEIMKQWNESEALVALVEMISAFYNVDKATLETFARAVYTTAYYDGYSEHRNAK